LKTLICQSGDGNGKCSGSGPKGKPNVFFSTDSANYNTFNLQRHLASRKTLRTFRAAERAERFAASAGAA
jgi:hypothetical protein